MNESFALIYLMQKNCSYNLLFQSMVLTFVRRL